MSASTPPTWPSFRDASLQLRALTHRSYLNEHPDTLDDNERLEFLGDAVLGLVLSSELYKKFTGSDEGLLTKSRAKLVNALATGRKHNHRNR